jgi:hypothetical protein
MSTTRTHVNGSSLVFYLEGRTPIDKSENETMEKPKEKTVDVMYNISKPTSITNGNPSITKEPTKVKVVQPEQIEDVLLVGFAQPKEDENNWLGKAKRVVEKEEHISKKAIQIPKEEVQLKGNWLDGTAKKSNGTNKETMALKSMKVTKGTSGENKEVKSSKPIF